MATIERGLALAFFRSKEKVSEQYENKNFLVWGSLDFLHFWTFSSLATIKDKDPFIQNSDKHFDIRRLYLYSPIKTGSDPTWILSRMENHPLLVISILDTPSSEKIGEVLETQSAPNVIHRTFRTFGPGNEIVIFRSNSYSKVLEVLTELSSFFNNSYSIAAIQMPLTGLKSNWLQGNTDGIGIATIKYRLLEREQKTSLSLARSLLQEAKKNFYKDVPAANIQMEVFYEIGQYDIEVRLQGSTEHLLYILLNSPYGLVNVDNPFYEKVILSKTIWKIEARDE